MMQTVIMGVVNIIFTLVAIFTVDRFGRKPLLIIGSIGMAVGAFAVAMCDSMAIKGILPVLSVIVYAAFFMMSWGPICWVLISEIFPNTIRGKRWQSLWLSNGYSIILYLLLSRHCTISARCLRIVFMELSV